VQASPEELERALTGKVTAQHRFLLGEHLKQIEYLETAIRRVSEEIARRFSPLDPPEEEASHEQPQSPGEVASPASTEEEPAPLTLERAVELIDQITGISTRSAQGMLAESGVDMGRFKSAKHLASWAGVCPGNHESAGKRLSGKTRKGNPWLRRLLIQSAHAAAHSKNTYLAAQYHRIASRRGPKRAAMAVAHSILVIIYHLLRDQVPYRDLGSTFFDERDRQHVEQRLVRRLERLGYQVQLQPRAQAG
jgi:transposase